MSSRTRARARTRARSLLPLVLALSLASPACKRGAKKEAAPQAPAVVVRDDREGLLLTWIDEKGEFHVEQHVKDVPAMARDVVKVVDPAVEESARGETIFRNVRGRINATHRGGDLTIEDAGTVRLNTRGSDVKLARITGEASRYEEMSAGTPKTTDNTPGGRPASTSARATSSADAGASSAGLRMQGHPAPSAAPILRAGLPIGKFHGAKAATGPTGSLRTVMRTPEARCGSTRP